MSYQDVSVLRKAGKLKEARALALELLAADPNDFKARSQKEWVIFSEMKETVARIESALKARQRANSKDVTFLESRWEEYRKSEPRVPEMACSKIVEQIARVGHQVPKFADIIYWLRPDGLRPEDWLPNEFEGKTYPSLAAKIALSLCKWIKSHPDALSADDTDMALEWIERSKENAPGDYLLWLKWNAAILLRKKGDFHRAAELLAGVIKSKRNESWVWAEAGRLYLSEQPELALACFCRALECPAEPKFLVRAHRELAQLLAEHEEYAQASREIAITIDIREAEGWSMGHDMESIVASSWYDPAAEGSEDPKEFYARHSPAALALCFDSVETTSASYLGLLIPHTPKEPRPGWKAKPLPRFAVMDDKGHAWSLVGPGMKNMKFELGAPLTVVIGRQKGEARQTIVHVSARSVGKRWDCLEQGVGVVVRESSDEKPLKIFLAGTGDEVGSDAAADKTLRVGDGVLFGTARNPNNDRIDVFNVERGEVPKENVKFIQGQLRRNPKGFAFVEDAFVAPQLVESLGSTIEEVVAMAVYAKHSKEDRRAWRVISINAL